MCTSPKTLLNEDIFRLSPSQPHSPTQSSNYHRPAVTKNTSLTICRSKTPSPQPPTSPQSEPRHKSSPSRGEPSSQQIISNWICPSCSFQNQNGSPRNTLAKCGQCDTENALVAVSGEKRRTSEDLHNDMNDQMKALSMEKIGDRKEIIGSDPDLRAAAACRSASRTASPMGSASNLSGSRHNLSADLMKWSCSVSLIIKIIFWSIFN